VKFDVMGAPYDALMSLPLPSSLSPSKVSTFKDCALQFRFSAIDKLPEPPGLAACKGTVVHRALELLFVDAAPLRTTARASETLATAMAEFRTTEDFALLDLDEAATDAFYADAATMVERYFAMEDPTSFEPVGLELKLEAPLGSLRLRGIIDRLDLTPEGELIVVDYKTGRVPSQQQEMARLGGVHFYSFLCEAIFGQRPKEVRLMYLGKDAQIITATPTEQSTAGLRKKLTAIWTAVERACENNDFRPRPSMLCNWCSFKEYCPSYGGDPAAAEAVGIALANERSMSGASA
jgi:putative RecB family exonuclease